MRRKILKAEIFIIPFVAVISIKNADASDTKVQRAGDSMSQDSTTIVPMDYIKLVPATSQTTTSTTVGAGSITNKPSCGESNNSILTSPPTSFLCVSGIASTVVTTPTTNGGENYSWTCSNTKGEVANCAATKRVVGTCGSANGSISSSAPTGNLCAPGTASPVTLNGSLYSWTCSGNYGSPATCSATYTPKPKTCSYNGPTTAANDRKSLTSYESYNGKGAVFATALNDWIFVYINGNRYQSFSQIAYTDYTSVINGRTYSFGNFIYGSLFNGKPNSWKYYELCVQ